MRSKVCVRGVLLCSVLALGFVSQARAEDRVAEPADQAASTTVPAEASTEATEAAEKARLESAEFERVAKQYKKTEKDGQTLYCRKEKTLGTRLAKPVCLTDAQLRARIQNAEEVRTEMSKGTAGPCRPPAC